MHFNYTAVGMSKSTILVVPSRYSVHNADSMDATKMLMLGLQGDRSHSSVTSMCFNQQGDLLLAGYADGHVTVWDVQKGSAAKVITGGHAAPVVHTLFVSQDSQATRQFKVVTGDCKGLVLLHACSVVPLINRFSIKMQCLLDGQKTGTVLAASPLHFDVYSGGALSSSVGNLTVSTSSIGNMIGGIVGGDAGWKLFNEGSSLIDEGVVVFVTHQTALVVRAVRLCPTLEVYAHLSKPEGVREGSMPYSAWKCTLQSHGPSDENNPVEATERVSYLTLAWDRKVQVAKLVKWELKVYGKWSIDSPAIGMAWLDDQMLVVLTLTGQLYLFAKDGTIIHQTNFAIDGTGGDDLIAYHTHFFNIFGNPEKACHKCVAVRGASIYVLGPMHLIVSRLLTWKERIQVLQRAGDWMGALNMAMTLYDGQVHGVIDLPRSLDDVQEAIMPYLVELLQSYVDEVFSYISVGFCNQIEEMEEEDDSKARNSSMRSEIQEQYTHVGGVAVEFCVHIKRTDILFDDIYSKFVAVQHKDLETFFSKNFAIQHHCKSPLDIQSLRHEYLAALDSYMKDLEEPIHAFFFINNTLLQLNDKECETFRSAIISRIPELVCLSREGAFFLVLDHFHNEGSQILSELRSHPKSLFLYLKTVIEVHLSGMLNFSDLRKVYDNMEVSNGTRVKDLSKGFEAYLKKISDFPRLICNNPIDVTDDMIELYLELLCQYERDSVLRFLESFDSYRVEHCLLLCQKYGIIDAAAFLLERVGDVGSVLLLPLSSLNGEFVELGVAVKTAFSNVALSDPATLECFSIFSKINEVKVVRSILHACIGLCQRNTPRLNPEESETLWFTLLDSFCEPLMDTHGDQMESKGENHLRIVAESLGTVKDEEAHIIKWNIPKFQGVAHILKKLFSQFIREIVEGMMGCVCLPTIMYKLLSDNPNQEFGDFKLTILGMLGTYCFERRILDTA